MNAIFCSINRANRRRCSMRIIGEATISIHANPGPEETERILTIKVLTGPTVPD